MTYEEIIEIWLRDFILTMDEGLILPGNRSGDELPGVKIIFEGYGYNEEKNTDYDQNILTYAIFIHKDSLSGQFPEHEEAALTLIHRPKEEVCIKAIYDIEEDYVEIIPFEDSDSTELDHEFIYQLIHNIHQEWLGD
jgi:hypothetical protein